jgi:predicted metal-binding protein
MECWSCGKQIPEGAKHCQFCEAEVEAEPTEAERQVIGEMLSNMPPEALRELEAAFRESKDGQDFVNRIMVGNCPKCDSCNTGDCDGDTEIDDICVGRCFDCGQLWCCE